MSDPYNHDKGPPPEPAAPPQTNVYRVTLLNSGFLDVNTQLDWDTFIGLLRANGYVMSPSGFIPLHAIVAVQRIANTGDNVVSIRAPQL